MDVLQDFFTMCFSTIFLTMFLMALAANASAIAEYTINGYSWVRDRIQLWD